MWEIQVINTGYSKVPWVCSYIYNYNCHFKEAFNFKNKNRKQSLSCARDLNIVAKITLQCIYTTFMSYIFMDKISSLIDDPGVDLVK